MLLLLFRPGTGKIWTVEGDDKLEQKMEDGDLNRLSPFIFQYLNLYLSPYLYLKFEEARKLMGFKGFLSHSVIVWHLGLQSLLSHY